MNEKSLKNYYTACELIMQHYGIEKQKQQLIQELAELIVALTKGKLEDIIEEMADVQVMIDQFTIHDNTLDQKMQVIQLEKIKRQLERIKKEREE